MNQSPTQLKSRQPALGGLRGFTLTEVVLAVGIVAFTLTSLTGLLMVGLNSNKNSSDETRTIYIAQQIFSDLRSTAGSVTKKVGTDDVVDRGKRKVIAQITPLLNTTSPEARTLDSTVAPNNAIHASVDLNAPQTVYVAYDENGDPLGNLTNTATFENSIQIPKAVYATKIEFLDAPAGAAPQPNLKRVKITVESPAQAKTINRERYVYETLVSTL